MQWQAKTSYGTARAAAARAPCACSCVHHKPRGPCAVQQASRQASHAATSTSGRGGLSSRPRRSRTLQVRNALLEPPAFQPSKLAVEFLPGASAGSPAPPCDRRYTLTHNDITGALRLSIGANFNSRQVRGFYTRVLRDEVVAEWRFGGGAAAADEPSSAAAAAAAAAAGPPQQQQRRRRQQQQHRQRGGAADGPSSGNGGGGSGGGPSCRPSLHVFCHVSGEERWLAPPQLRNFVFRREMTLVLDTFLFADRELLRAHPWLRAADVLVHFESARRELDVVEHWGTLGDRRSWQRMPKGFAARLRLLLGGFPDGRQLERQPCGALLLREGGGVTRRWGADQAAALGRGGALRQAGGGGGGYAANSGGGGGGGAGGGSAPFEGPALAAPARLGGRAPPPSAAQAGAAAVAGGGDGRRPLARAAAPDASAAGGDAADGTRGGVGDAAAAPQSPQQGYQFQLQPAPAAPAQAAAASARAAAAIAVAVAGLDRAPAAGVDVSAFQPVAARAAAAARQGAHGLEPAAAAVASAHRRQ
ncbi:histone-lysine N-methyltransferase [Raphidocelis subcapitata]|uniref:Histone-lysine N-methyltransferase n=1 Tax=Raphidocelis subcapitata TaxID=307507 RepID=A0A2V0NT96_9CHLO|nr:histone-lysine N-methyltransferase [Raphidocelis subcapitata]|eukprot:GBF88790.1 histone-lysine N-methyltransferase [Raphidocelis subcapitata]